MITMVMTIATIISHPIDDIHAFVYSHDCLHDPVTSNPVIGITESRTII